MIEDYTISNFKCKKCGATNSPRKSELKPIGWRLLDYTGPGAYLGYDCRVCDTWNSLRDAIHIDEVSVERNEAHPIDLIRNPPHYKGKTGLEAIDVIEAFSLDFNLGNVVKYILRSNNKNKKEDLKKARQYLNRAISGTWDT